MDRGSRVDVPRSVDLDRALLAGSLDQIIQAPIIDAGRLKMSNHICRQEYRSHGVFRVISNGVALFNGHGAIHLDMELHEHTVSAVAGTDVMHPLNTFATEHCAADPLSLGGIEFPIEELIQCMHSHVPRIP
jgi:hypothetical protein